MDGRPKPRTISTKQARIASLARQMPEAAIRSLSHHMDLDWMREAYRRTRKDGAAGIDGQTATMFAEHLEENLQDLLNQAKSGTYRAPPVRRVHIPKGDGSKTRPLGIPTFSDKVLQRAVVMLLEPLYEQEFYDLSYGFRPRRGAHDALAALDGGFRRMGGGWVVDADIQGFFDAMDHAKLREMVSQRVADGVVLRLIGKWLRAGVMEEGTRTCPETGSPQGGVISPLLSNIYLHVVMDDWWTRTVLPRLGRRAFMVRYADDFVMVFSTRKDARKVYGVLPKRAARYGLTMHPEKTRLIRYRPTKKVGGRRAGSFDFLGFTHYWGRSRKGRLVPKRKTATDRFTRALRAARDWMKRHRHLLVKKQAQLLGAKLRGHYAYYGLRGNSKGISRFRWEVIRLWRRWLSRRSQKARLNWATFLRLLDRHPLPQPRLVRKSGQLQLAKL